MNPWKHYRNWILGGAALLLGVLFAGAHFGLDPWVRWEKQTEDLRARQGRWTPQNPDIVFLAIDPTTFTVGNAYYTTEEIASEPLLGFMTGEWPWPRNLYASVIERLLAAGAKRVMVDVLFHREGKGDEALAAVLEKYADRIILAANLAGLEQVDARGTRSGVQLTLPSPTLLPNEEASDSRLGYVNFWPDRRDSVVRQAVFSLALSQLWQAGGDGIGLPQGDPVLYSLAGRMLLSLGAGAKIPASPGFPKTFRFTGPPGTFTPHPFHTVVSQKMWERNFGSGTFFRDKIVMIGPLGNFFKDDVMTPFGMFPGAELHLHALNAAWHGEFLQHVLPKKVVALIFLAVGLAWGLCRVTKVEQRMAVATLAAGGYVAVVMLAYNQMNILLPVLSPLAGFIATTATGFIFDFVLERSERARLRATFERYVSRNVVSDLLDRQDAMRTLLGGQRRPITVLFSDIRNFTSLTEQSDSSELVAWLNEYLTAMVQCVFEEGGTLDKFIGDAVMAVWGNVLSESPADDARRAVRCAVKMSEALRKLNLVWESRGWSPWHIGIGINHGEAIVGNMGSPERMEFTVIGDAVNLASRLEGLTKLYGQEILLGETLDGLVGETFELLPVDTVKVKGKQEPVTIFCLLGGTGVPQTPADADYAKAVRTGYGEFRQGHGLEASEHFRDAARLRPDDSLAIRHLEECERLSSVSEGGEIPAARVMTEK